MARLLRVTDGAVRYHRWRVAEAAFKGRGGMVALGGGYHDAVTAVLEVRG